MRPNYTSLGLCLLVLISWSTTVLGDDAVAGASTTHAGGAPPPTATGAYNYPPPPAGGGPGGFPIGGAGFPVLFPGFFKNFDLNWGAGVGPYGGGFGGFPGFLGGLGGPPLDGGVDGPPPPDVGGGPFGGFPWGGGFLGPSYLPQTWIGSALGAKGDLLFPLVIFVFFVVGIWTVIQFLLGFIVPLIATKLAVKSAPLRLLNKRDDSSSGSIADIDFLTTTVLDAINEPKCLKYVACHTGNFLNGMAGGVGQGVQEYEGILKTLSKMTRSEALDVFETAFVNTSDCSKFTCDQGWGDNEKHDHHDDPTSKNSTVTATHNSTKGVESNEVGH